MLPIGDDSNRHDGHGPAIASLTFFVLLRVFAPQLLLAPVLHYFALLFVDARPVARTRRSRDSSH